MRPITWTVTSYEDVVPSLVPVPARVADVTKGRLAPEGVPAVSEKAVSVSLPPQVDVVTGRELAAYVVTGIDTDPIVTVEVPAGWNWRI